MQVIVIRLNLIFFIKFRTQLLYVKLSIVNARVGHRAKAHNA